MRTLRRICRLLRWGLLAGVILVVVWKWRQRVSAPEPEPAFAPSPPAPAAPARLSVVDTAPAPPAPSTPRRVADAPAAAPASADARAVFGRAVTADDLKIVEGIGPKIADLLRAAGIRAWAELAAADQDRLKAALAAGGSRYRVHDPATWPEQAALAAAGDWTGLKRLQDELKGGRRG
jgi:predicted flap endonuclease-1-like 5' DNA nuclease